MDTREPLDIQMQQAAEQTDTQKLDRCIAALKKIRDDAVHKDTDFCRAGVCRCVIDTAEKALAS
jgi:hypothetical protein